MNSKIFVSVFQGCIIEHPRTYWFKTISIYLLSCTLWARPSWALLLLSSPEAIQAATVIRALAGAGI